jgi:hypothetical protein
MTNVHGSMTVLTPDKLRSVVTATGGAGEAELAGPVRSLREAGGRAELVSIKPGQLQAVRHDLQPVQTFAAARRSIRPIQRTTTRFSSPAARSTPTDCAPNRAVLHQAGQ